MEIDKSAFQQIHDVLDEKAIATNKYRTSVGIGKSQCFGMVRKRSMAPDLSRQSWLHPKLHHLLMEFARLYVDIPFTSIQVNDCYPCAVHTDKHNLGDSFIVGLGDYQGGALRVWEDGKSLDIDIKYRPYKFNGSLIRHETAPFTGRRISLVYHTLVSPSRFPMVRSLSDYEAVAISGQWMIAFRQPGLPVRYLTPSDGLDHPLKGRKKDLVVNIPPNPFVTEAQNLLFRTIIENHK